MAAPRPRPRRAALLAADRDRHRDRRRLAPTVDLAQRRHRDLPGDADRGGRRDVRVAAVQRRGGARRRHRARALALHPQVAHREAVLRAGQPGRRGGGRRGVRRHGGRPAGRARRRGPGRWLWDVTVAEYQGTTEATSQLRRRRSALAGRAPTGSTGVGISAAPLVYDGKVFVGIAGVGYGLHPDQGLAVVGVTGQYGRPGTDGRVRRADRPRRCGAWNVTGPGWEGALPHRHARTACRCTRDVARGARRRAPAHADAWRYGGGSIYATPVVDADRHLLIFGTGNPSPQMADASRPGDNLYTSSLVALDLRTGKLVWHYQQVPHDRWGYDVASPPVLLDVIARRRGGARRWPRRARPAGCSCTTGATGGCFSAPSRSCPSATCSRRRRPGDGVVIAPGIAGGANWSPSAYDPGRRLFFVGALHLPTRYIAHEGAAARRQRAASTPARRAPRRALGHAHRARPRCGRASCAGRCGPRSRWSAACSRRRAGWCSAGRGQGRVRRVRRRERTRLWSYQCDAGVNAPPVTYRVGGAAVRRRRRRRQRAVRLQAGRHGDGVRAPGVTRGLSLWLARVAT